MIIVANPDPDQVAAFYGLSALFMTVFLIIFATQLDFSAFWKYLAQRLPKIKKFLG
jgi:hypothetical protein